MRFTDIFVRRPVLATVVSLLILLVGLRSASELEIREYPKTEFSTITVFTAYPGADAELVQGFVTTPLQQAMAEVEGIDYIESTSEPGLSTIRAYTRINYDVNDALSEIQGKVASQKYLMPPEVEDPSIWSGIAAGSLMYIAFTSTEMDITRISDYLTREVQPRLQAIEGVGTARLVGRRLAERIWIDPARLAAVDMTPQELVAMLRENNYQAGVGSIRDRGVEISLKTNTDLNDPDGFRDLVIKEVDGSIIRLGDIARTELGSKSYRIVSWLDGKRAAYMGIEPAPGANPLTVARRVKAMLPTIKQQLPDSMDMTLAQDKSAFIEQSVKEVNETILETILIVLVVIFLTLGSARAALIPAVTVPLSLIGGAFIMLMMGFSLNLLTLLSLILAVGLVVDDAIIVVENVHRHMQEGKSGTEAALEGAREIAVPVIAMTVTLLAVYAPIGFMGGLVGSLFTEFAFTLAGAVLISGIIALTLSPMMSARVLRPASDIGRFEGWVERQFERTHNFYRRVLEVVLQNIWVPIFVALVLLLSIYFMYQLAESELAPSEDEGMIALLGVGPQNAVLDYLEPYGKQVHKIYQTFPEYETSFFMFGNSSPNTFASGFKLIPWEERERDHGEIARDLQRAVREVTGVNMAAFTYPSIPGSGGGLPVKFVITTGKSFEELDQVADTMLERAMASGKFSFLQKSVNFDRRTTEVVFDRDRVADLGLSMADVGRALSGMLSEGEVNRFNLGGRAYEVTPQADWDARDNLEDLENYYFRADSGELVPLRSLVSFRHHVEPSVRTQHNQYNAITLEGATARGVTIGDAVAYFESQAATVFPREYAYDFKGEARQYKQQGTSLVYTFFLSLLVIYLVLAALFESWRDPLIILVSVPLAVVGALAFIMLGATTMNIYTQVGLITLIGVISKNGILIVEFANKIQAERHLDRKAAVIEAATIRLRPILMTTAALVVAMVPLLMASGPGANSRFALGLTIATGLSIGTVLTLLILPAFYILLARDHEADREKLQP